MDHRDSDDDEAARDGASGNERALPTDSVSPRRADSFAAEPSESAGASGGAEGAGGSSEPGASEATRSEDDDEDYDDSAGFGNSPRRIATEIVVVIAVIVAVGVGAMWAGGSIASAFTPWISTDIDRQIGAAAFEQMGAVAEECPNPEAQHYVEELARPLVEAAGEVPFDFTFRVVSDDSINAFALPGGFVTVNSGLLEAADSGEEVAGVLAHELQHVLKRHGTRRILRQVGGRSLLWAITGGTDVHAVTQSIGSLTSLGYDRDQETEADLSGLALLERAGIDPSGLGTFFERLQRESAVNPPELLSTHPDSGGRAQAVREAAEGAAITRKLPSPQGIHCRVRDQVD